MDVPRLDVYKFDNGRFVCLSLLYLNLKQNPCGLSEEANEIMDQSHSLPHSQHPQQEQQHHHHYNPHHQHLKRVFFAEESPQSLNVVVKEILADVHSALTTKQRLSVLSRIESLLTGGGGLVDEPLQTQATADVVCRLLIEGGILPALVLQLNFVLQRHGTTVREVDQLWATLHLLTRHCPGEVRPHVSNFLTGNNEGNHQGNNQNRNTPSFLDLLSQSIQQQQQNHHHNHSNPRVTNKNVICLLHTVSGTPVGARAIVKCRPLLVRLLDALQHMDDLIILVENNKSNNKNDNSNRNNSNEQEEVAVVADDSFLLEALGCLKNITCYAEDERKVLICLPGFQAMLSGLCRSSKIVLGASVKASERISAILRNLVLSPDCRGTLGRDPDFLNALLELLASNSNSSKNDGTTGTNTSNNNRRVLRNVLNIVHSLSMENDAGLLFLLHGDGIFLNVLQRLLAEDDDSVIRRRSARTFRLLTNEASAPLLVQRSDLMSLLSQRALNDENAAVRSEAAQAFSKCAGLMVVDKQHSQQQHDDVGHYCNHNKHQPPHHNHYHAVLDALLQLSQSPGISMDIVGRALREQASHPDNRIAMGGNAPIVQLLAKIAAGYGSYNSSSFVEEEEEENNAQHTVSHAREDACCALCDLAQEVENRGVLLGGSTHDGNDDKNSEELVLYALVKNAQAPTYDHAHHHLLMNSNSRRRQYAVTALVHLASVPANRPKMAKCERLLPTLIQYAAMTASSSVSVGDRSDGTTGSPMINIKSQVKNTILVLVREL